MRTGPTGADGAPLLRPELVIIVGGLIATAHASMSLELPGRVRIAVRSFTGGASPGAAEGPGRWRAIAQGAPVA